MKKIAYEFIKQSFENEKYQLLSIEYINHRLYSEFICSNNHRHKILWCNWKKGIRCGKCSEITFNQVKESFESEGYILLSTEYISAHKCLDFICPNGHQHKINWNNWKSGRRCKKCVIGVRVSKVEKRICEYIKSIYFGKILENDRTQVINPKTGRFLEFDIWLPEIRKAIEYNGRLYHNNGDVLFRDNIKRKYCEENDIGLLVIDENNWLKNNDFDMIKLFINGLHRN